jgi:DNA-binding CsgD family transcriptional regulator
MNGEATRGRIRELVDGGAASLQQIADTLGIRPQTVAGHIARMDDPAGIRAQMDANKPPPRTLTAFGEAPAVGKPGGERVPRHAAARVLRPGGHGLGLEDALAAGPRRRGQAVVLTDEEVAALKAAADRARALPRVHRNTAADAPERGATGELRRLIRQAAERASIAEIARAAGLSHQQTLYHRDRM